MNDSKISVRYAKALFSLALEQNVIDEVKNDVLFIQRTWENVKEMRDFLESPIIKPSQKKTVIQEVFFNHVNKLTQSFLGLVLSNKRESYLAGISRVFVDFYKKHKGITSAVITTTQPIDMKVKTAIIEIIKKSHNANVELEEKIKPEIIGGFVLRIDDKQVDASISTQLKKLKKELLNTTVKS